MNIEDRDDELTPLTEDGEGKGNNSVMVAIRIRPLTNNDTDEIENISCLHMENNNTIEVLRPKKPLKFNFDFVG